MEQDREKQVWQRVMGQPEAERRWDPAALLQEALELAAVYRRLTESLTGRGRAMARKLMETEQSCGDCLRGIGILSGHPREGIKLWEPAGDSGRRMLEKCYHRTRRCQAEYTARSLDPEFGEVFRELAVREGRQCVRIAELLGWMK